jgi:hypothetical protein
MPQTDGDQLSPGQMEHALDGSWTLLRQTDGLLVRTHGSAFCEGDPSCCIHNPSDHPLRFAPLRWVQFQPDEGLMFRVCRHDTIHPDPDALLYSNIAYLLGGRGTAYDGWHPCCVERCCTLTAQQQRRLRFDSGDPDLGPADPITEQAPSEPSTPPPGA